MWGIHWKIIVRNRQGDFNIRRGSGLKIIYIFDGLDEVHSDNAGVILQYIANLCGQNNTHKIIISCRDGSPNKWKVKQYLPDISEYDIQSLQKQDINGYFEKQGDAKKVKILKETKKRIS